MVMVRQICVAIASCLVGLLAEWGAYLRLCDGEGKVQVSV